MMEELWEEIAFKNLQYLEFCANLDINFQWPPMQIGDQGRTKIEMRKLATKLYIGAQFKGACCKKKRCQ